MIDVQLYDRKVRLPDADYVLENFDDVSNLLSTLTPKFTGQWKILLVDLKVVEVKELLNADTLPEFIDCIILLPQNKLEPILLDFPKFLKKQKSAKDTYKDMVAGLVHLMDKNAMWTLYQNLNGNIPKLEEALRKLDAECEGDTITVKQVRSNFNLKPITYASDVISAFLTKDRHRWLKYSNLVADLGEEYAFYALYKQVRILLTDKNKYLHNEDFKNYLVEKVDAPFICYVYTLFASCPNWRNLYAVMYRIDHRSDLTGGNLNAYLQ